MHQIGGLCGEVLLLDPASLNFEDLRDMRIKVSNYQGINSIPRAINLITDTGNFTAHISIARMKSPVVSIPEIMENNSQTSSSVPNVSVSLDSLQRDIIPPDSTDILLPSTTRKVSKPPSHHGTDPI